MSNTIYYYTKEAFAGIFIESDVPFAGEKSWVPMEKVISTNSFTVMFIKHNVFIRLFVSVEDTDARKSKQITEELAKRIVNNIDKLKLN